MTTYKDAGVDIDAGDAFVEKIAPYAAKTRRSEVISGVGGFAGLFALPPGRYKEPVLVSGTDGVGTKLKIAFLANRHATVGIDLVAMSVNDVITCGAEPLFFLDYFATSKLQVDDAAEVVKGIARGCEEAGCTLLGGETAELPGFYAKGEYDLAGFCVGVVERAQILDGKNVAPGDALVGLASSGLHSNGYSLARKVLLEDARLSLDQVAPGTTRPLVDELLEPTRIYVRAARALLSAVQVKGMAHITGSGIPGNLPRVMPEGTQAVLDPSAWRRPAIFDAIEALGNVPREEMYSTFNMGLGLLAIVPRAEVSAAIAAVKALGIDAWEVGRIEPGAGEPRAIISG
ncbi:MAG: phosphoribosylformylglycinamidine cyclo-ligase [Myxococcaceae bacterium]|nr:phosphoribosylformylglycinamidine cyclo-ligase [Myxococcaceae bacterium]